jgi:hypothetical protein
MRLFITLGGASQLEGLVDGVISGELTVRAGGSAAGRNNRVRH